MKLHLPKLLRHAVLACVAAVAGVTTTIGTATFTGGLVAVTLAGHQARADWSGDTYYLNSADTTLDASERGDLVTIMAGDAATYDLESLTMKEGQQLLIAPNPEGDKNIEKLTITDLTATNADITIQANQTLALGQAVMTAANKFASIQVEGTLDLTAIENLGEEYGQMAEYSKNWSKMTGSGTVKLAKGLHLQSANNHTANSADGGVITLATNFVVGGADVDDYSSTTANNDSADLILQSHAKFKKWRDWDVVSGGSLTVGVNGKGVLNVLSGNRLDICGGTVEAGIIRIGHNGAADNVGAVSLSNNGTLTVGNMLVQGAYSEGWDNAVSLLDGTVEFTSQYAVSYVSGVAADVTLGGTGDEQLKLVAKTDWGISKETSKTSSSFIVGNVLVDSANTAGITLTSATLTGAIDNQKTLSLAGTTVLDGGSTITNSGTLSLAGTTVLDGGSTITNSGSLSLAGTLRLEDWSGLDVEGDTTTYSDGENGTNSAKYWLVKNAADGTVDVTNLQLQVGSAAVSCDTAGGISFDWSSVYHVRTEVTYDSETMAELGAFLMHSNARLTTGDATVLSKVQCVDSTSAVILDKAEGIFEVGNNNSAYDGNIIISAGTTVKAVNAQETNKVFGTYYYENRNKSITLEAGAGFDFNGRDPYYKFVLNEGATLSNTGAARLHGSHMGAAYIELAGNAVVNADKDFGLRFAGAEPSGFQGETLDLAGYTLTKKGESNFFLKNTTVTAGTIDIQEGTVWMIGGSDWANVDLAIQKGAKMSWEGTNRETNRNLKSLVIYDGSASRNAMMEVGNNVNVTVTGTTKADVLLEKLLGGTFKLAGDATLAGGLKVSAGTVELQGATALGGLLTIENGATLAMGESASVTISGLAGFMTEEGVVSIPETNSLVATGDTVKIVDNKNADNANNALSKVTYKGTEYTLTDGSIAASGKVYYAVEAGEDKVVAVGGDSATAQTNEATEFYVGKEGTLKIAGNASDTMTAAQAFLATTGSGTVEVATNVTIGQEEAAVATGVLKVTGATLENRSADGLSSFSSVLLENARLDFNRDTQSDDEIQFTVNNVSIEGDSIIEILPKAWKEGANLKGITTIGKNGKLRWESDWNSTLNIEELTGEGDLSFESGSSNEAWYKGLTANVGIGSGFTGAISINDKTNSYTFDILSGAEFAAGKLTNAGESVVNLTGAGAYSLGSSTAFEKHEQLAEGWTGTVKVTGANVTSSVDMSGLTNANSSLAINGLTVADGGALTLGGAVTLDGTVTLAESITNNGTLAFGENLKLDLTGMEMTGTSTKVITLLTGDSIDISQLKVSNLSDATLALGTDWKFNADGTISYASLIVTPDTDWVWEGDGDGGGVWGNNATNWQPDSGSTTSSDDVVFGTAGAGEVQIDGAVAAKDIAVTGGTYTFTSKNNAATDKITATSLTIEGANTSLAIENTNAITTTNLNEGELVLKGTGTTGGNVVLGGGLLKYDGSTLDISSNVSLASGYTGPVKIEVVDDANTTDVESVTWTKANKNDANGGVDAILANGIVKTGAGTMNVEWQYGTSTNNGAVDVQAGTLNYISKVTPSAVLTMAGDIHVAENASFRFTTNAYSSSPYVWATISGSITGKGTVEIGTAAADGSYGQYKLSGDNTQFEGILKFSGRGADSLSGSNVIVVGSATALGGQKTTLELNGRQIWFGSSETFTLKEVKVNAGTVNYINGSSGATYNIKATLTGSGQLISYESPTMVNQLSGNISGFTGQITAGNGNTWLLGGADVANAGGTIQATLNGGTGTVKTQYSDATVLSGPVGGSVTLEQAGTGALTVSGVIGETAKVKQSGAGTLILTAANTSTGTMTIDAGKVQLGTATDDGSWAGMTLAGAGTLEMVNGSLSAAMSRADGATASIVVNAAAGKTVSLGNTSSSMLSSVTLAAGSKLTGVADALTVGSDPDQTFAATAAAGLTSLNLTLTSANIGEGTAGAAMVSGSDIAIYDASKVSINLATQAEIDLLKAHKTAGTKSYLTLTDGTLTDGTQTCSNSVLQELALEDTLAPWGIKLDGVSGGSIVLSGTVDGIYFVTAEDDSFPHTVDNYETLGLYKGTVLDANQSLDIKLAGDDDADTQATLNNLLGGAGSSLVVTNTNADGSGVVTVVLSNQAVANTGVTAPPTIDTTTTMQGSITGNKGTELVKAGDGTLVVNGKVVADELDIQAGALNLNNAENTVTTLNGTGGTLQLGSGSKLTVNGGSLADVAIKAATGATAAPTLDIDGDLALTGTSALTGLELDMSAGKKLSLAATTNDVVLLSGSGEVQGVAGTILSLDNTKAATYSGSFTGAGSLEVEKGGAAFTLKNVNATGWDVTNKGKMVVDMTGSDAAPGSFAAKALTLTGTSETEIVLNTDNATGLNLESLTVEQGASITLTSTGLNTIALGSDGTYVLGDVDALTLASANQTVTLSGIAFSRVNDTATLVEDGGKLKLQMTVSQSNKYKALTETKNGEAGAELMWNAASATIAASPVLSELDKALSAATKTGESQDELLASIAGASTAVLGMAVSGDVDRQLQAIRNRTTTMGVDQGVVNPEMPYFNAWINAEGDNRELTDSGTEGGYKLNSWGGTVGFDVDFTPSFTAGLALTAMYGDLDVTGVDEASGDLDTYYVSAFARYCASAWTHTFVATAGLADLSLSRTVAGEEVKGSTDGMSFGLMYEVGRVYALNEDATTCVQPIFNVSWRHSEVDGYTEKGSDLALEVDKQTYDTLTFGAGARLQAVVGESIYNRTSIFEWRALLKVDAGDRQGSSEVSLAGATAEVESAEMGAVGLEAGAGLTIPLGDAGSSIFADASIEVRSDYTNVNGTIGYRINF